MHKHTLLAESGVHMIVWLVGRIDLHPHDARALLMVVQQPDFNFTKEEIKDLINIKSELQRLQRRMRPTTSVIRHLMDDPNVSHFPIAMSPSWLCHSFPIQANKPPWHVCGQWSLHQKDHDIVHGASHGLST